MPRRTTRRTTTTAEDQPIEQPLSEPIPIPVDWEGFDRDVIREIEQAAEQLQVDRPGLSGTIASGTATTGTFITNQPHVWGDIAPEPPPTPALNAEEREAHEEFLTYISRLQHFMPMDQRIRMASRLRGDGSVSRLESMWANASRDERVNIIGLFREHGWSEWPLRETIRHCQANRIPHGLESWFNSGSRITISNSYGITVMDLLAMWNGSQLGKTRIFRRALELSLLLPNHVREFFIPAYNPSPTRTATPRIQQGPSKAEILELRAREEEERETRRKMLLEMMLEARNWDERSVMWDEYVHLMNVSGLYISNETANKYRKAPYKDTLIEGEELQINLVELSDALAMRELAAQDKPLEGNCELYNKLQEEFTALILKHKRNKNG